jgi:allantoin racemase
MEAEDAYWEAFLEEGRAAVDKDGADVIVVASMTMQRAAELLHRELGIPVIDPGPLALRTAESLVRLGLSHSRIAWQAPTTLHDQDYHVLPGKS